MKLKLSIFLCALVCTLPAAAQDSITCASHSGQLLCEVIQRQTYEPGKALRIAASVRAKTATFIYLEQDSIYVSYQKGQYAILVNGIDAGSATTIRDTRNMLVAILSTALKEE